MGSVYIWVSHIYTKAMVLSMSEEIICDSEGGFIWCREVYAGLNDHDTAERNVASLSIHMWSHLLFIFYQMYMYAHTPLSFLCK